MLSESLLPLLNEIFVNVTTKNVDFSLGDLFDPSQLRLTDVFMRTEIVNALQLPFELKAGYIGDVKIDGIVGFVAGSALQISVENVSIVLGHNPVDWTNDLAARYAKELVLALLQTLSLPSPINNKGHGSDAKSSPAKWILTRIQSGIAETTVKIERVHLRFESNFGNHANGKPRLAAYGAYMPSIEVSTRATGDQILHRRQQPGIVYPGPTEIAAAKLLSMGNISIYCDLDATSFTSPSAGSDHTDTASTTAQHLQFFREQCNQAFPADATRDLVHISALWVKLDIPRGRTDKLGSFGDCAIDIATDKITMNATLEQFTAISTELQRVTTFLARRESRQWRPCSVDRERTEPPRVSMCSPTRWLAFPLHPEALKFPLSKQRRDSTWLRGMWKYAVRATIANRQRDTDVSKRPCSRDWMLGSDSPLRMLEAGSVEKQQRYMELYRRSLDEDTLACLLYGRAPLLSISNKKTVDNDKKKMKSPPSSERENDTTVLKVQLPILQPLGMTEQWELSDLVFQLPISEQRAYRTAAMKRIQQEASLSENGAANPTEPLHNSLSHAPITSIARGNSESVVRPPSPTHSPPSPPRRRFDSAPPVPISNEISTNNSKSRPHAASSPSPRSVLTIAFPQQEQRLDRLVPLWIHQRGMPLINWHIGQVSIRLYNATGTRSSLVATMKVCMEYCDGCILFSRRPSVRFLVEFRLGLVSAALFCTPIETDADGEGSPQNNVAIAGNNSISTDYINEPSDGFLYLGLKYNFNTAGPTTTPASASPQDWDIKGKLCLGTIRISYDENALREFAIAQNRTPTGTAQPKRVPLRVDSASYAAVVRDVLSNWMACLRNEQSSIALTTASLSGTGNAPPAVNEKTVSAVQATWIVAMLTALMHQSSCVEVEVRGLQLLLSLPNPATGLDNDGSPEGSIATSLLAALDDVQITLPTLKAGLEHSPQSEGCRLHAGGAQLTFRTTSRGRAALVAHVLQSLQTCIRTEDSQ